MSDFFLFLWNNFGDVFFRIEQHFMMVSIAIMIAILVGIPLGIILAKYKSVGEVFIYFSSVIFTIPSLALFGLLIPVLSTFGHAIGYVPAIIAVVIYSLSPIVRNTFAGINAIDPKILEVADGMGMTWFQKLFKVTLPLSMPAILSGVRISLVLGVATVTVGTYIGAGGLGWFIARGISQSNFTLVIIGAVFVSLLALTLDMVFTILEKKVRKI